MIKLIAATLATSLLLVSGVVHGLITDRWTSTHDLQEAASRFDKIPLNFGDWEGQDLKVKASSFDAMIAGHIDRRYVNRLTGESVVIGMVVGRSGPVSIHTPDVCYSSNGYVINRCPNAMIPNRNEAFLGLDAIRARVAEETKTRLYWAWNAGNGWMISESPRVDFAHYRVLHKLYVTRDLGSTGAPGTEDSCVAFMKTFLPILDQELFGKQ